MSANRLALVVICVIAVAHGWIYVVHQRPDWDVSWTDQGGYKMLAHGIATSGAFTRYPEVDPFVPEAIRTPGYPAVVAAVYLIAGESHLAVAVAQILVFAAICVVVYALARRVLPERGALIAAALVALYPPLPYFAALVLTELWTTFAVVIAIWATWQAIGSNRVAWFAIAGVLLGYVALCRPVFVLLAPFLAGLGVLMFCRPSNWRPQILRWGLLGAAAALTLAPWFVYNYRHFGIINISAAGGIGRPIFESSWQGVWPGRVQAALTDAADTDTSDADLAVKVREIAAANRLNADPMLKYVGQWREIRKIWTTPTDPDERFKARIIGDQEYLSVGLENIRQDIPSFLKRRVVRGQFVLWAAEIPIRHTQINALPDWVIRAIWLPQIVLVLMAAWGVIALARRHDMVAMMLLAGPLVYVAAVHFLLLTESRQSLPVKPLVIVLAVTGWGAWRRRPVDQGHPSAR